MFEGCDVAYKWILPSDLPAVLGWDTSQRRVMVSPRVLRVEHWPSSDSPGALHVFIDGVRVRADGTLGTRKGLGFSDEPARWDEAVVQHTDALPAWAAPYVEAVRAWEAGRGNPRPPRLRLL